MARRAYEWDGTAFAVRDARRLYGGPTASEGVARVLEELLAPLLRRTLSTLEPEIQAVVDDWLRTPQGRQAIVDILAEVVADLLLPTDGRDGAVGDILVGVVRRAARQPGLRQRLTAALAVPEPA